jgi:hypothetical protein
MFSHSVPPRLVGVDPDKAIFLALAIHWHGCIWAKALCFVFIIPLALANGNEFSRAVFFDYFKQIVSFKLGINKNITRFKEAISTPSFKYFQMTIQDQIDEYISSQPEQKRSDMEELHRLITRALPGCRLWFLNGKDSEGKIVSNPNIGYGFYTREFYQIGMSANTTGISIYVLGIPDKTYLAQTYGKTLGKASVTGYCIKFKALKDINIEVLEAAIRYGVEITTEN